MATRRVASHRDNCLNLNQAAHTCLITWGAEVAADEAARKEGSDMVSALTPCHASVAACKQGTTSRDGGWGLFFLAAGARMP